MTAPEPTPAAEHIDAVARQPASIVCEFIDDAALMHACRSIGAVASFNVSPEGAELNITYNLSGMLREAGFIGWSNLRGMDAQQAGVHILAILDHMRADEPRWRAMNPENGWGDYDKCIQDRMRQWAKACAESPKGSTVGASL